MQRMPICHKGKRYENSAHAHKHSARVEPAERRALCLVQRLRQEEPEEGPGAAEVRHLRAEDLANPPMTTSRQSMSVKQVVSLLVFFLRKGGRLRGVLLFCNVDAVLVCSKDLQQQLLR